MYFLVFPVIIFLIFATAIYFLLNKSQSAQDANSANKNTELRSTNNGCLIALANLLLRPVPVIYAFYQYDFKTAVIAALVMWVVFLIHEIYAGGFTTKRTFSNTSWIILPMGAGATLLLNEFTYFQLIPTTICLLLTLEQLIGLGRNTHFIGPYWDGTYFLSDHENKLLRWGLLVCGIIGVLISEYFRHNLSLATWIWYYGYLRIELILIALVSAAPALAKRVERA